MNFYFSGKNILEVKSRKNWYLVRYGIIWYYIVWYLYYMVVVRGGEGAGKERGERKKKKKEDCCFLGPKCKLMRSGN